MLGPIGTATSALGAQANYLWSPSRQTQFRLHSGTGNSDVQQDRAKDCGFSRHSFTSRYHPTSTEFYLLLTCSWSKRAPLSRCFFSEARNDIQFRNERPKSKPSLARGWVRVLSDSFILIAKLASSPWCIGASRSARSFYVLGSAIFLNTPVQSSFSYPAGVQNSICVDNR